MDTQIIVIGAGPVGLMLAGELRLGGADVVVVERLAEPTTESRASTLHARSMELLDQRGLLDGYPQSPREAAGHFGGIPLDLTGVSSPYAGLWKLGQPELEARLADWATGLGAAVLRRHELTALAVTPDGVRASVATPSGTREFTGAYIVGCDGEYSTVRRLAGIDFPGRAATRELLRADIDGVDIPNRRFHRLPGGLAIASRRPDGVTRVMMAALDGPPHPRADAPEFAEICAVWHRLTGEDLSGGHPVWRNAFDNTSRQAATYQSGPVLLAGDAAHQGMPVGGQAINLGLQDAANLGWKLAIAANNPGARHVLATYHPERYAAGRRTRTLIDAQAALLLGGSEVDGLRAVIAELLGHTEVRDGLANAVAGTDVRYPASGGHDLAGMRVPAVGLITGGRATSTTALLRSARGALLVRPGAPVGAGATGWSDRVELVFADPVPGTVLHDVAALLLRPDGHAAHAGDLPARPEAALHEWFGPAR